jgi:hypothetical protein
MIVRVVTAFQPHLGVELTQGLQHTVCEDGTSHASSGSKYRLLWRVLSSPASSFERVIDTTRLLQNSLNVRYLTTLASFVHI